jgi:hypothetical protein
MKVQGSLKNQNKFKTQSPWSFASRLGLWLSLPVTLAALSGCGGKSYTRAEERVASISDPTTPAPSPTPTPTPSPSPSPSPTNPPYTFTFQLNSANGFTYTTPAIPGADSILRVTVRPQSGTTNTLPGYEQYNFNAGCFDYKVAFSGSVRQAPVMRLESGNTWLCPQAPTRATTDFSSLLGGSAGAQITVSNPRYDLYCQWWYQLSLDPTQYNAMCPMKSVYQNHQVTAQICVQTNGTLPCQE